MKIVRYEYLSRYSEAIRAGQEALALFGLMFPTRRKIERARWRSSWLQLRN